MSEASVKLYRPLAQQLPGMFGHPLARALRDWSEALSEQNRHAEALAAQLEAVEIFRGLYRLQPKLYILEFLDALDQLSAQQFLAGQIEPALTGLDKAIVLARRHKLAGVTAALLNNKSRRLADAGRIADAEVAALRALAIYQKLGDQVAPDEVAVCRDNLARAQNSRAVHALQDAARLWTHDVDDPIGWLKQHLTELLHLTGSTLRHAAGDSADETLSKALQLDLRLLRVGTELAPAASILAKWLPASRQQTRLRLLHEAVRLNRELSQLQPYASGHRKNLAVSLMALSLTVSNTAHDAVAAAEEAENLFGELGIQVAAFVDMLTMHVLLLLALNRPDDAIALTDRYTAGIDEIPDMKKRSRILRARATALHDAQRYDEALAAFNMLPAGDGDPALRATTLLCVSRAQAALGLSAEALRSIREAVEICRLECLTDSIFLECLLNYAYAVEARGLRETYVVATAEALERARRLEEPLRQAFVKTSLLHHTCALNHVGRRMESLPLQRELVTMLRASEPPDGQLACALVGLSDNLFELGRFDESLSLQTEALEMTAASGTEPSLYAISLLNLSMHQARAGQFESALGSAQTALEIYRTLAEQSPRTERVGLSWTLTTVSRHLCSLGRYREALGAAGEALQIQRPLAEEVPERYRLDLAESLCQLSRALKGMGRAEHALRAAEEALTISHDFNTRYPLLCQRQVDECRQQLDIVRHSTAAN